MVSDIFKPEREIDLVKKRIVYIVSLIIALLIAIFSVIFRELFAKISDIVF